MIFLFGESRYKELLLRNPILFNKHVCIFIELRVGRSWLCHFLHSRVFHYKVTYKVIAAFLEVSKV